MLSMRAQKAFKFAIFNCFIDNVGSLAEHLSKIYFKRYDFVIKKIHPHSIELYRVFFVYNLLIVKHVGFYDKK